MEVCGWGKPIPAHLNKQVIMILSARGVPDQNFLDLQREALDRLLAISQSHFNTEKEIELLESTWRAKNAPNSTPGRAVRIEFVSLFYDFLQYSVANNFVVTNTG